MLTPRETEFSKGDTVRIYPHGSPETAVLAEVLLLSGTGRSIALQLKDRPEWAITPLGTCFREKEGLDIVMMLSRYAFGPWIEVMGQGHYEIEPIN